MKKLRLIALLIALTGSLSMLAQREVTPVESDDKKPQAPVLHYYDKHGDPLDEPVLFLATLDTVASPKVNARPIYPKFYAVEVGVNIFDAFTAIAGQKYGGADIHASLSLWNWVFPTIELGLAGAHNTPKGNNYTYVSGPSFYCKLGADYNFLYKSNPDYRFFAGLRLGITPFSFALKDITPYPGYWGTGDSFSMPAQSVTAVYGEFLLGLRVNIVKRISLGWSLRIHHLFHNSSCPSGDPWYIPGMGTRGSKIGGTFSVSYTLPLAKKQKIRDDDEVD